MVTSKKAQRFDQSLKDSVFAIIDEKLLGLQSKNRESVLATLESLDRDKVVIALGNMLKNSDAEKRVLAVDALMNIDLRETLDLILPFLRDPDSEVRWTICNWLCTDGDSRAIEPLINVLKSDQDVNVRTRAACALGASRDFKAKDALLWARDHDYEEDMHGFSVQYVATIALQHLMEK